MPDRLMELLFYILKIALVFGIISGGKAAANAIQKNIEEDRKKKTEEHKIAKIKRLK